MGSVMQSLNILGDLAIPAKSVMHDVLHERVSQHERWGQQDLPYGTGGAHWVAKARHAKEMCELARDHGNLTHRHVLIEEVYEAFAESDPVKLRAELIQVAAVATKIVEQIDRDNAITHVPDRS